MTVETIVEAPAWADALPDLDRVAETAARAALLAEGRDPDRWEVCLLACDNARIAELNAGFRGRAAPTNVLSWPAFDAVPPDPAAGSGHLGDLALALEMTSAEARTASISLKDHATHLILHGCLHLLGHDHETVDEAEEMEETERRILAGLGIADPYNQGDAREAHPDG